LLYAVHASSSYRFVSQPLHNQVSRQTTTVSPQEHLYSMLAQLLNILLWPIHKLSLLIFPPSELDGLSAAVTAKAAQQFVSYLSAIQEGTIKQLSDDTPAPPSVNACWQASGFEAVRQQAQQNKSLILVYVHSLLHPQSERLCRNLLCHTDVLKFCQQDGVMALGLSVSTAAGLQLQQLLQLQALPCLALLQPTGSSTIALHFRAQGPALLNLPVDRLLRMFREAHQQQQSALAEQMARQMEREEEAALRRSQEEEYEAALAADRERQEQQDMERRKAKEEEERAEAEERAKEQKAEEEIGWAISLLQPEPEAGGTKLRFVLPSGAKLNRRFGKDETVAALRAFLFLHFKDNEIGITNIGMSTNFPRRTYSEEDNDLSLEAAGLVPQAVIMVQDLDA